MSNTSISLSWSVLSSAIVTQYEVTWQRNTALKCHDVDDIGSDTINNGTASYYIMGLEEDSSYSITVTVSNPEGSSELSDTVTAVTGEAGER